MITTQIHNNYSQSILFNQYSSELVRECLLNGLIHNDKSIWITCGSMIIVTHKLEFIQLPLSSPICNLRDTLIVRDD